MRSGLVFIFAFWFLASSAFALPKYLEQFKKSYPKVAKGKLDACLVCHPTKGKMKEIGPFAQDFKKAKYDFTTIGNLDSDQDRFLNTEEITVGTFPGDKNDQPDLLGLIDQLERLQQKIAELEEELKKKAEK